MTQDPAASGPFSVPSRRDLMAGGAAVVGALAAGQALAQPAPPQKTRWRRWNITSPQGQKALASYGKAIDIMLRLDPKDPNNWYNHTLTHTIDCPHGNWWFVVWHRGYVGLFEQTVRKLSGDPDFAFPYWDWTADPQVPAQMFQGVFDPSTYPAYIQSFERFKDAFNPVLETFWKGLRDDQVGQLLIRGLRFPADLMYDIGPNPNGAMFFPPPKSRGSTAQKPGFDDITNRAVSASTLYDALSPRDFIGFASPKSQFHSSITGFGVMEGMPHNKVHNCVGGIWTLPDNRQIIGDGFMQSNMSPVDPLFFLHHANIDRIWDLWTRKQQGLGYPTLPDATNGDLGKWRKEPFVFFRDADGQWLPPERRVAGAFESTSVFDYDYQPGSGEQVVPPPLRAGAKLKAAVAAPKPQQFVARLKAPGPASVAAGDAPVPQALLTQAAKGEAKLMATLTVELPPFEHGVDLAVVVNTPESEAVNVNSPGFVTTLSMFGHHLVTRPITFTVPISQPLAKLSAAKGVAAAAPASGLNVRLVRLKPPMLANAAPSHDHAAPAGATIATPQLLGVEVHAY